MLCANHGFDQSTSLTPFEITQVFIRIHCFRFSFALVILLFYSVICQNFIVAKPTVTRSNDHPLRQGTDPILKRLRIVLRSFSPLSVLSAEDLAVA